MLSRNFVFVQETDFTLFCKTSTGNYDVYNLASVSFHAKPKVVYIPANELMGPLYPNWYIYHFQIEFSSGISTILWTHYAKHRVVYRPVNELMGYGYPKWYVYHLWIDSSNGICTALWMYSVYAWSGTSDWTDELMISEMIYEPMSNFVKFLDCRLKILWKPVIKPCNKYFHMILLSMFYIINWQNSIFVVFKYLFC